MPHLQRMDIRSNELFLALELLADEVLEDRKVDVKQRRQHAHVNHVLEQLPLS